MSRSWTSCTIALAAVFLLVGAASADPKGKAKKPQQVVPTGAEDSPQAPAPNIAAELALEQITSRSDAGLSVVVNADGSESLDLQGRFHSVLLRVANNDGDHAAACFSGHEAKAHLAAAAATGQPATVTKYQRLERHSSVPMTAPAMWPAPKAPVVLEVK